MDQSRDKRVVERESYREIAVGLAATKRSVGFKLGGVLRALNGVEVRAAAGISGLEVDDPDVALQVGNRRIASEKRSVDAQSLCVGGEGVLVRSISVRREQPEADGISERVGERGEDALRFGLCECGRKTFAAQAGSETRQPVGNFGEQLLGGSRFEADGEQL